MSTMSCGARIRLYRGSRRWFSDKQKHEWLFDLGDLHPAQRDVVAAVLGQRKVLSRITLPTVRLLYDRWLADFWLFFGSETGEAEVETVMIPAV